MASTQKTIIVGSVVLISVGVLAFVIKKVITKGKEKKANQRAELLSLQQKDENIATQNESASGYNPKGDYDLLEGYIVGPNLFYYPTEVNDIIFKLSDVELKKLADYYKSKQKESLYKTLDGEWDSCGWFENCYTSAMARLSKLGKR